MTAGQRLQAGLQAIADAAAKARREVSAGGTADLGTLEALVSRLDPVPPDLTSEESEQLRKAVLLLVAELDELRDLVRSEHENLRGQLEGTGTRRSAAAAYAQLPNQRR